MYTLISLFLVFMSVALVMVVCAILAFVGWALRLYYGWCQKMARDLHIKPFPGEVWRQPNQFLYMVEKTDEGVTFRIGQSKQLTFETWAEFEVLRKFHKRYRCWSHQDRSDNEIPTPEPKAYLH